MRTWGIYSAETGIFRQSYTGPDGTIAEQLRDGERAVEGDFDHRSQRVDTATGKVIARERSAADEAAQARLQARREVLRRIRALEAGQARALREIALGYGGAKDRLLAIDSEIERLRVQL